MTATEHAEIIAARNFRDARFAEYVTLRTRYEAEFTAYTALLARKDYRREERKWLDRWMPIRDTCASVQELKDRMAEGIAAFPLVAAAFAQEKSLHAMGFYRFARPGSEFPEYTAKGGRSYDLRHSWQVADSEYSYLCCLYNDGAPLRD